MASTIALALTMFVALASEIRGNEVEYDYGKGPLGPEHWGELKPEWKACSQGRMQSPIDLVPTNVKINPRLQQLRRSYHPANASILNRGHDIEVKWPQGAGAIHINGTNFTLQQCHWHSPSEHTLDGKRFPLEIHLVHETEEGQKAVVGLMYTYGRPDSFLAQMVDEIRSIADMKPPEEALGIVDPRHIKKGSRKYYRYVGSLTTPPCTEGVIWTIVKKVRTVSRNQVKILSNALLHGFERNARPIQETNGRNVELYTPAL